MNTAIFKDVDAYISRLFAREDAALAETISSLVAEGFPQHSISAGQGKFLQLMALLCKARNILELGTLGGYSTIWLARALPPEGKIVSIELNKQYARLARQNIGRAGLGHLVEIRTGNALEILPRMIDNKEGPFDLVFIDADKPPYTEYFGLALTLSRPGTLIICDNVIREGMVLDENSSDEKVKGAQRFNRMLSAHPDVSAIILATTGSKEYDGMALAVVSGSGNQQAAGAYGNNS